MKFTSYIYTLLGVLCLYACSDEDNNGVASSDSNGVVFSANKPVSRPMAEAGLRETV